MLIVLEGIDGAGTTTQTKRLARALGAHATREPSDGPVGKLLRSMLRGDFAPVDANTLALLFAADRADHLHREVSPVLTAGRIVVSDRWYHSSLAYQGSDADRAWISTLNERALTPDLTLFLEVSPTVAAQRRKAAGRSDELFDAPASQQRVAANYRYVIESLTSTERIKVIDGHQHPDKVAAECLAAARRPCSHTLSTPI